jgi:hypothetical protein
MRFKTFLESTVDSYPKLTDIHRDDEIVLLRNCAVYHTFYPTALSQSRFSPDKRLGDSFIANPGTTGRFVKQYGDVSEVNLEGQRLFLYTKNFENRTVVKGTKEDWHKSFFNDLKEDSNIFKIGAKHILTSPLTGSALTKRKFPIGTEVRLVKDFGTEVLFALGEYRQTWKCSKKDWKNAISPLAESVENESFIATSRIPIFVPRLGSVYDAGTLESSYDRWQHGFIYTDDRFFIVDQQYCTFPPEYVLVGLKPDQDGGYHRAIIRRADLLSKAITLEEYNKRFLDNLRDDE